MPKSLLYFRLLLILVAGTFSNGFSQTPKLDSLNNLIQVKRGDELLGVYIEAAKEYVYIAPVKSVEYGEKVLSLGREINNHSKDGIANLVIGAGYIFSGNFEKGKQFTDIGLKIATETKNVEEECTGLNSLAVYYMNTGNYKLAVELFQQTLNKAIAANLPERVAMADFNLGAIYTSQGRLAEGLSSFLESLKYFLGKGNNKFIARNLMNIAVNYHASANLEKALDYYKSSCEYFEKLNDQIGLATVLNNMGEVYKDKKNFPEAIKYYNQSLAIAISLKSKLSEAVAYVGLAEVYMKLQDRRNAEDYARKSLEIFESIKMMEGISRSRWVLGEVEFLSGHYGKAMAYAGESSTLAEKAGIPDIQVQVTLLCARILEKMGDYSRSNHFLQRHIQLKDSLFNDRQTKRLAAMQTELDLKVKENEIVLLQKENEIKNLQIKKQLVQSRFLIAGIFILAVFLGLVLSLNRSRKKAYQLLDKQNKQISDQHQELVLVNETKDRFLSIIGHDLRNPVGAFSEMLGQLVDAPEMFDLETRNQILKELRKDADSTYYLLDNLLSWAKNQKGNIEFKPEAINLQQVIQNNILLNSRISENKGILLTSEGNCDYMVFFDINMLNLIFRNLISNALKFSYSGGIVQIKAFDEGERIRVCVCDHGVGIDEENIPLLFDPNRHITTYGTANEKGSGLGLLLCHEFIKNDGGELDVSSEKGVGTTICFTLRKV